MKHFLFFVLFFFFTIPAFGQDLAEVDFRVNGIGSGTSYSTVVNELGNPLRSEKEQIDADIACSGSAETHLTLFYSGLEIKLLGDGEGTGLEVVFVEVTSEEWSASGVSIGEEAEVVRAKFGEPNSKNEILGETVFYYVTKGNLGRVNFYFRNNKLIRIAMTVTLC